MKGKRQPHNANGPGAGSELRAPNEPGAAPVDALALNADERAARLERQISLALMQIRMRSPFFATLALFARVRPAETTPTAATDGRDVFVNPGYFAQLTAPQRAGLLLHEVLHAALLHVPRRGARDPLLWNIAADIVVNGVIAQEDDYEIPPGSVERAELAHLSVEEVYHALRTRSKYHRLTTTEIMRDTLDGPPAGDGPTTYTYTELAVHWGSAQAQAEAATRMTQRGTVPAALRRELGMLSQARLDWRSYLWRFLVRTPTDFQGYDRRFVGQGLYLDALDSESISVHVAVDTSGSVEGQTLDSFLSEVRGILSAYPHIQCLLYYADARCYGPYPLLAGDPIPPPQGGGGTDFRPFFAAVAEAAASSSPVETNLCIYLTDGEGDYPETAPEFPTLWVVTPGGIALEDIPFGETVRLITE